MEQSIQGRLLMAINNFTEEEIELAITAHNCTREEAISTYAAMVRTARQAYGVEINLRNLRFARNQKLAETDWWANSDLTMTTEQIAYRQALRDITNTYNSLETVVWPTKP